MEKIIHKSASDVVQAAQLLQQKETITFIQTAAQMVVQTFEKGGKILTAGNGGSLCDAMHLAEEFTGQFRQPRKALPAIALSESGHITCTGNDMGFDQIFARAIEALGKPEDIFIALSTSGNSENLIYAVDKAKEKGLTTVAFLGKTGGKLAGRADLEWIVKGFATSDRIQEVHMAAIHIMIECVEAGLFSESVICHAK
jgi:D-sedoheptulose 7-phosphate isomerase